jgi:hypothetical protein
MVGRGPSSNPQGVVVGRRGVAQERRYPELRGHEAQAHAGDFAQRQVFVVHELGRNLTLPQLAQLSVVQVDLQEAGALAQRLRDGVASLEVEAVAGQREHLQGRVHGHCCH